ncbi:MAG: GxxExxY protein [Acidobacteria bacterium]|nr:MAG: GxxExxY protein [Acidobacteriota bacterium]
MSVLSVVIRSRGTFDAVNDVTGAIIGGAIEVHRAIGPGLLESAYQECMGHELFLRGVPFLRQHPLPVHYKGVRVDCAYRLDFLVDDVVLEIKSVSGIDPIHVAQVLTYMKLGEWKLGLLINFNVKVLTSGIRRLIL